MEAAAAGDWPTSPFLQLVAFHLEGQRYALPLGAIERVLPLVEISPLPEAPPIALGVFNLHGRVIPVLDIRRRFGLPPRPWGLTTQLLVAQTARRTLAFPVDEVQGLLQVAPAAVSPPQTLIPGVGQLAGIVSLSDGLLFIHDLEAFLSLAEEERLANALERVAE